MGLAQTHAQERVADWHTEAKITVEERRNKKEGWRTEWRRERKTCSEEHGRRSDGEIQSENKLVLLHDFPADVKD